jgi:hypothetical protein
MKLVPDKVTIAVMVFTGLAIFFIVWGVLSNGKF